jgi:serpin B
VSADEKQELRSAIQGFAFDVYAALTRKSGEKSFSFSPLSLMPVLGMLIKGMEEEADQRRMLERIGLQMGPERFHLVLAALMEDIVGQEDTELQIKSANALVCNSSWELKSDFVDILESVYGAELFQSVDGSLLETVNTWVKDKTDSFIPSVLEEVDDDALVLINALAFDACWQYPFDPESSKVGSFTCADGQEADCTFMNKTAWMEYSGVEGLSCVRLPYKSQKARDCAFLLFLPEQTQGLAEVEKLMSAEFIECCVSRLKGRNVQLSLPRLSLEHSEEGLKEVLSKLGLPLTASLGGMCPAASLDKLLQKVKVSVDEVGTHAAAASLSLIAKGMDSTPLVRADHPFAYTILVDGFPVFMGAVRDKGALMSAEEAASKTRALSDRSKAEALACFQDSAELQALLAYLPMGGDWSEGPRSVAFSEAYAYESDPVRFTVLNYTDSKLSENGMGNLKIDNETITMGMMRGLMGWSKNASSFLLLPHPNGKSLILAGKDEGVDEITVMRLDKNSWHWFEMEESYTIPFSSKQARVDAEKVWESTDSEGLKRTAR